MRILFKNCTAVARKSRVSGDGAGYDIIKNAYLGVDGKYIDYLSDAAPEAAYDEVKDMEGAILLPAFINAHGHASMTLLRGAGTGLPLQEWLNEAIFPIEAKLTPEHIELRQFFTQRKRDKGVQRRIQQRHRSPQAGKP